MNLANLPLKTYEEAIKLKKIVADFIPSQYHEKIEFSFQIFDAEQIKKLEGWRMGFSTFTIDDTNNFVKVLESKPNPKKGKGNITSHTHLTRNEEKETIEGNEYYLKFGYVYIHWKLLISGDTPRHKWDVEKLECLVPRVDTYGVEEEIAKGQSILQPIYVGESGAPGKSDFFERSTKARSSNYLTDKLNWRDEIQGGYVIWIINGLPTEWRLKLETHLIEFYGRADLEKGPLVNRTDGGQHNRGRLQGSPRNAPETVKKLSEAAYKREETISEETKANRSAKISATRTGRKFTEDHKAAISAGTLGVPKDKILCEHCNEEFAPTPFARYHGDNCTERPGLSDIRDDEGNLLTWSEANKQKHKAINQANEDKRQQSRKIIVKWVHKETANKTPDQKLENFNFWKTVQKQPRRWSEWFTVAFEKEGQWYSVDEGLARRAIIESENKYTDDEA